MRVDDGIGLLSNLCGHAGKPLDITIDILEAGTKVTTN